MAQLEYNFSLNKFINGIQQGEKGNLTTLKTQKVTLTLQ